MSNVIFNPSDLGDASSFKSFDYQPCSSCALPKTSKCCSVCPWIRPTNNRRVLLESRRPLPEQVGTDKNGNIIPLMKFDIFDMIHGF